MKKTTMSSVKKLKFDIERRENLYSLRQMLHRYNLPILVLCFGMGISIFGFIVALNGNINRLTESFKNDSNRQYALLTRQLETYISGLKIAQVGLKSTPELTKETFNNVVTPLLSKDQFEAFLWITEPQTGPLKVRKITKAPETGLSFLEAISNKNELINSLKKSQKQNTIVTTKNFTTSGSDNVIAIILPISVDTATKNYAVGILDLSKLFKEGMKWNSISEHTKIYIYDVSTEDSELIYRNHTISSPFLRVQSNTSYDFIKRQAPFLYEQKISVQDRKWQLVFTPTHIYLSRAADFFPWSILAFGMLLTIVLSAFIFSLVTGNIKIQEKVNAQTSELRNLTQNLIESEEKIRAIVNNTVDGIITIDEQGIIESYNFACETIFGYSANEVMGRNISMLMPSPYRHEHDRYLENYTKTGQAKIIGIGREVQGRRKDGSIFPLDLAVGTVQLGDRTLYCGTIRDITERKRMYEQLHITLDELAKSNKELEQFAYIASHDLKAPLRAIEQLAGWLEEDLGDKLDEDSQEHMDMLRGRVARMETLLNDLLEYSRVGRVVNKNNSVVSADEIVEDITLLLSPPPGFTIQAGAGLDKIHLQKLPIHQVLLNLISNSIKHHDKPSGKIEVSVVDRGDNNYVFTVSDDGPGIPERFHEKAFEMFQTLQPRDRVEGSGMGLALVKKIVSSLGGEITMESEIGKGTSITFTWPLTVQEEKVA